MIVKLVGALALGSFLGCAALSRAVTPETPGGPTPAEAALRGVEAAVQAISGALRPAPVLPQAPPQAPRNGNADLLTGGGTVALAAAAAASYLKSRAAQQAADQVWDKTHVPAWAPGVPQKGP